MAVKLHFRKSLLVRFLFSRWGKTFVVCSILGLAAAVGTFSYYYVKYGQMIEEKLGLQLDWKDKACKALQCYPDRE